jgi:cullin 2
VSHFGNLYDATKELLEEYVTLKRDLVRESVEENFLSTYSAHWEEYKQGCIYLDELYVIMNGRITKGREPIIKDVDMIFDGSKTEDHIQQPMLLIGELGRDTWKNFLMEPLKDKLIPLVLCEIEKDRGDVTVNQAVLHNVIHSFVDVEICEIDPIKYYKKIFEAEYLHKTGDYYTKMSQELLARLTCSEYMKKALLCLDNEYLRSCKYLHPSSRADVIHVLQQKLVADHIKTLEAECKGLIQEENRTDLSNMYALLKPIDGGLSVLTEEFETCVRQTSLNTVKSITGENMATMFVESMVIVHTKYLNLIHTVFCKDEKFIEALDRACRVAVNHKVSDKEHCRAAELMARYCDELLKKCVNGVSDTEVDNKLTGAIAIFKYVDDKDVYNRHYSHMLSKRLIYGTSHSMDAEESMISRLKQVCGYEFTTKMHRIFTDMSVSINLSTKFGDFTRQGDNPVHLDTSVQVLQSGLWPMDSTVPQFALPQEYEKSQQTFEKFYGTTFNGRKLTWMYGHSDTEIELTYLNRTYFITMGTYLASLLLPFNNTESIVFKNLLALTQLERTDLLRNVKVILDSKLLTTDDSEITDDTVFNLNMNYSNTRTELRLMLTQKDTVQETKKTRDSVDGDRRFFLQAAIVRIMKSRQVLKHTLLIQEVLTQAKERFAPNEFMITKCIETLVEKEYLEKAGEGSDEYKYIA